MHQFGADNVMHTVVNDEPCPFIAMLVFQDALGLVYRPAGVFSGFGDRFDGLKVI